MRKGISITVTPADRVRLDAIVRDRNSPQKHVWRARIVLLTADGKGTNADHPRGRQGQDGRSGAGRSASCTKGSRGSPATRPGPRAFRRLPAETVDRVVALDEPSAAARGHPLDRTGDGQGGGDQPVLGAADLDAGKGFSRIGCAAFKLSNDPKFADKLKDVVGLYVDPPAHAVVLSIDEKSQIQALDRTQPGLPMKKGRCATMTHDYKRNGTTTLFAALDILEGKVIGRCMQRHRHQEFIRFLNAVEREVPADKAVHVVLDNYATHKHPKVTAWLQRHQRFTFHFTPTSCSWANAVEGLFAKLTRQRLKRGVFTSIVELQAAINRFIAETNDKPKPFVWTKSADAILAAVRRGRQTLEATS